MGYFFLHKESEGGEIDITFPPTTSNNLMLKSMTTHANEAATTSEDLTLTRMSGRAGTAFDTVVYRIDLAAASTVDDVNTDINLPLMKGDTFKLTYPNSDGVKLGIEIALSSGG